MSREQPIRVVPLPQRCPLTLALQSFLLDCQARGLSAKTLTYYRQDLTTFLDFLRANAISTPTAITAPVLRSFLARLQETHNAGGVHGHYRAVRAFLRFLTREGDIADNPLERVAPPKTPQTLLAPVSLDTVSKLLKVCTGGMAERDAAIILTLLDSGLRASELCALDVGDLDIATGRVIVRRGKGGKARVAFLGARARRAILKMLKTRQDAAPTSPLWLTENGDRLTYWGLRQILRRRAHDARVPAPSAHSFRRAFALLSLRGGCDIYSLQRLMGHADLTVLRRYLAQTEDDLRDAHRRSSPVDRMRL